MTEFTTNKMTESSSLFKSSTFSSSTTSSQSSKRIWLISIVSLAVVLGFGFAFFCFCDPGPGSSEHSAEDSVRYSSLDPSLENECTKTSNKSVASCCWTDSCKRYTRLLRDTMDFSVDQCEDFHGYVCGNWHKHKPAHKQRAKTSHIELQLGRVFKKIRLAIEEQEEEEHSVWNRNRSRIVQYAIDLQYECNDAQRREKLGIEPVGLLLQDVFGGDRWPLLQDSKKILLDSHHHHHQWMDTFVEAQMLGVDSLIQIKNTQESWIIHLQRPRGFRPECGSKVSEDLWEKSFQKYKKSVASTFLANGSKNGAWNSSHNQILFEVVSFEFEFESTICKMLMHNEVSYDTEKLAISIKLADLKQNFKSFDWTLLLNKFGKRNGLKRRFSDEDLVQLSRDDLDKLKSVVKLICSTPIRVWKNFVGFKLLAKYPNLRLYLDKKNREMQPVSSSLPEETDPQSVSVHKQLPLWNVCLLETAELLLPVYARMYIDYVGRGKMASASAQVTEMVQHLKESFGEALADEEHSAWLDESKRHFILDRLATLRSFIAYPNWILQDDLLDREYGFELVDFKDSFRIIKGNYLASSFNLIRRMGAAKVRNPLSKLRDTFHRVYGQIAQYQQQENSFVISYQILFEPIFDLDYPIAFNYGSLGSVIAHEMMHAFQEKDCLVPRDSRANWSNDPAFKHFDAQTRCFYEQYHNLVDPITGIKVNGMRTLNENIADNGGLKYAFRTFQKHLKHLSARERDAVPPFLAQFSQEQLFFIAYGQNRCFDFDRHSRWYEEEMKYDVHAPDKFRVNVPAGNLGEFALVFQCPAGSPMRPEHKCAIW